MLGNVPVGALDGAVLHNAAFLIRFFNATYGDRLLLINLGPDLDLHPCPEPLLAPPHGSPWHLTWSSEEPKYGGSGTPGILTDAGWHLPGHSAILMTSGASSNSSQ